MQLAESNDKVCKVKGAMEYSESDEQVQIQAKSGETVYSHGEKPGNDYPDLEPGNKFWNRVWVPGFGYRRLAGMVHFHSKTA